jgi:hypothetical protein
MHRLILDPGTAEVDHINGDTLDNRRCNLRLATHAQNMCNNRMRSHNTSGYRGVFWYAERRKWGALIVARRKRKFLGLYADAVDAARAYDAAAIELHGEFASLNFPC